MFFASLTEWTFHNVLLRMITALLLGGLIGIDRGVGPGRMRLCALGRLW